jgi:hypothetical protein
MKSLRIYTIYKSMLRITGIQLSADIIWRYIQYTKLGSSDETVLFRNV